MIEKTLVVDARFPLPARRLSGLVQQAAKLSRSQAEQVIRAGGARVNGRGVRRVDQLLDFGDQLEVTYDLADFRPEMKRESCHQDLEILFEDSYLIVVSKPPDLLTVPTPQGERTTLIGLLRKRLEERREQESVFCVHRLDRGVSGILVFAKQLNILDSLKQQFADRKPKRRYLAIVRGRPDPESGTIRSYLKTDEQLNRYSSSDPEGGQLAITHYQVLADYGESSLVEVRLETGRRNQIRVHLAEAGHPVMGDPRYGREYPVHVRWPYRRLALHAESLGFQHPVSHEPLEFRLPLPPEMLEFQRHERRLHDRDSRRSNRPKLHGKNSSFPSKPGPQSPASPDQSVPPPRSADSRSSDASSSRRRKRRRR